MTTEAINLDTLILDDGPHDTRKDGVCLMEAVAWFAGRGHTDAPPCVSLVLRVFGIRVNDVLPPARRQELKTFIPDLVGTYADGLDMRRAYLAADWACRTVLPALLRHFNQSPVAAKLCALEEITSAKTAALAADAIDAIRATYVGANLYVNLVTNAVFDALHDAAYVIRAVGGDAYYDGAHVACAAAYVIPDADAAYYAGAAQNELHTSMIDCYRRMIYIKREGS